MTADPALSKRRRRRRLLFVLVALGLSLGLSLALLELGLRSLWTPPSVMAEFQQKGLYCTLPDGSAGLQPGYRGTLQLTPDEPRTTVAVNSLGMRGDEPGDKRDGEYRLLCVGDSMVFGYGVEHEQTFAHLLETTVRGTPRSAPSPTGRMLTVGNGGISGFNSFESARRIGQLRPVFAPDAVLYCCYLGNDAIENRNTDTLVVGGLRFAGASARLMQRSTRARWMARSRLLLWLEGWLVINKPEWSLLGLAAETAATPTMLGLPGSAPGTGSPDACLFLDVVDESTAWPAGSPPALPRALADFRAALQQAQAAAARLPLHVLILPMWCHVDPDAYTAELRRIGFDPAAFRRGAFQERLVRLCAELALPVMDATPWLAAASDTRSLFVSDRGHLSPRGHAVIAEHLAVTLKDLWAAGR